MNFASRTIRCFILFVVFCVCGVCFAEEALPYSYYLPYFRSDSSYATALALRNTAEGEGAHVSSVVYGRDGTPLVTDERDIPSRGQTSFLIGGALDYEGGWIEVSSDQPLTGLCFVASKGADTHMYDITLIDELSTEIVVPHIAQSDNWDSTVLVCNPHDSPTDITLTLVNQEGSVIESVTYHNIPAMGSRRYEIGVLGQGSGSIEISAENGVAAFALYDNVKLPGRYSIAGISAVDSRNQEDYTYYLPYFISGPDLISGIGYVTGVALRNGSAEDSANVSVMVRNEDGNVCASESKSIPPRGQTSFLVGTELNQDGGWIEVSSDQPLTGLCFVASATPDTHMFDITLIRDLCKFLSVPHVAQGAAWDSKVLICNPSDQEIDVTLTLVDTEGTVIESTTYQISAMGRRQFETAALGQGSGSIEISASSGVAAFALYDNIKLGKYSIAGISALMPPVTEDAQTFADEKVAEGTPLLDSGDYSAAKAKFAEALDADPDNPGANAGYSLSSMGENEETYENMWTGAIGSIEGNDLTSGQMFMEQIYELLGGLPFIQFSSESTEHRPLSLVLPQPQGANEIDIDLDVPNSLKEIVLRITHGVPVYDSSYFGAMAAFKDEFRTYVSMARLILPLIRKVEATPGFTLELPAAIYKEIFGFDMDGDGIDDLNTPADSVIIDQGDFYIMDAMLSMVIGLSQFFEAYDFTGSSFEVAGDTNADGYIDPDEYLPPEPYYTLLEGGAERMAEARIFLNTAFIKLERGIDITLAEPADDHEILPVNADPDLRVFLNSLKDSADYMDLSDLKAMMSGPYLFDFSKGPFSLAGQSITVNFAAFFNSPLDLRDYLPSIRVSDQSMHYRGDDTLGGMIPGGDLDDVLNYALGIATLTSIPIITSLSSTEVALGGTLDIYGEGFGEIQGDSTVTIGNRAVPTADILFWSEDHVQIRIAPDTVPGRLRIEVDDMLTNSVRISIEGIIADNFDEVLSAEMAGDPPTTIDSGLYVYDIYDVPGASLGPSRWLISADYPGYMLQTSDIWYVSPDYWWGPIDPEVDYCQGSNLVMQGQTFSDFVFTAGFAIKYQDETWWMRGSDNDGIGIVFRYQDEDNYYRLMSVFEEGPFTRLEKFVGGEMTVLALTTDPADVYVADEYGVVPDDINVFTVEVSGTNIKAYINDRLIFNVDDATFATGRVGISTYAMCWTWLDYITVEY